MRTPERARSPAEVYEDFFVPALFEPCARELVDLVELRPGETVLDLACGTGVVARQAAAAVGGGGRVVGLDLRPGMLAVASSLPTRSRIEWVEGDALALPFPEASFDVVLCQQGLQFFPDRATAIAEMRRVLVPGGRLGIAIWQGLERNRFMRELSEIEARHLEAVGLSFEDVAAPFLLGEAEEIRALVADRGFDGVHIEARSFDGRFPAGDDFVADLEYAYSVMVPEFADDAAAFAAFVAAVSRDAEDLLARHREGGEIVVPMHVNLAAATAAG